MVQKQNVSINDVARRAKVSITTVSRVINNVSTVSDKNRIKVEAAIAALKFKPNVNAQRLARGVNNSIGLVMPGYPGIFHSFYAIELIRGIEVGHVFQLGTKYSKKLKATFLNESGKACPFDMGCYGIGIGRTVAAAIEQNHDQYGIIWPLPLAPFEIIILPLNTNNSQLIGCAKNLYAQLIQRGVEVLLDDRLERAGVKFKDADLIGIPLHLIIGERALKNNHVEIKIRKSGKKIEVNLDNAISKIIEIRDQLAGKEAADI